MRKLFLIIIALPVFAFAQYQYDVFKPKPNMPRVFINGDYGYFRISLDAFDRVYAHRWNTGYQAGFGVRVYRAYYATAHYGEFSVSGKDELQPLTGISLKEAQWNEKWIKVGVRTQPKAAKRIGSFYGAGLAFFNVQEKEPITVFSSGSAASGDEWGSGFYMLLGLDYEIIERLGAYFSIEISSGGTRGRSGFEAMSIGGWRLAAGLQLEPF